MKYQGGIFLTCFLLTVGQLDYCSADLPKFFLGGDDPAANFRLTIEGPAGEASFVANGPDDRPLDKDLGVGGTDKTVVEKYGDGPDDDPNKIVLLARSAGSDSGLSKIFDKEDEKAEKIEVKKETRGSEETEGYKTAYEHRKKSRGSPHYPNYGIPRIYKKVEQKDGGDLDPNKPNNGGGQFRLTIERDGGKYGDLEDYEEEEEEIIEGKGGSDEKYYTREEKKNADRGRGRGKWKVGIIGHGGRGRGRGKSRVSNSWYGERNRRGGCQCGCPNCNNGYYYTGPAGGPHDSYYDTFDYYYF